MSVIVSNTHEDGERSMAEIYSETMMELMKGNRDIVELEADLGFCMMGNQMNELAEEVPGQIIDCGIQEANMTGVACGLSFAGKIPFAHSFAPFISRRANDQIFISGCYAGANVKLVGSDPGIMAAYNGGTHMPFEDVAVLRAFPGMTIVEPTDHVMLKNLVKQLAEKEGMYYIRCARKNVSRIYEEGSEFEIGKGNIVKDGTDASVIASGIMVAEALKAAQILEDEGISVRVVDMFTIKPLDCGLTVRCAQETKAVVTAENHNIHGGLYGAVCEVLAKTNPVPVEAVGIKDEFGEVGDMEYLKERFGLTADDIAQKVRKVIERKRVER